MVFYKKKYNIYQLVYEKFIRIILFIFPLENSCKKKKKRTNSQWSADIYIICWTIQIYELFVINRKTQENFQLKTYIFFLLTFLLRNIFFFKKKSVKLKRETMNTNIKKA